jgi:hypothetical protein
MVISISKLAPRATVLAVVGYCVWPSLSYMTSQPETKPPGKLPELAAALLSPKMPSCPTRDPFGSKSAAQLSARRGASTAAVKLATKEDRAKSSTPLVGKPAEKLAAADTSEQPVDPLNGLTLDATCIVGRRRAAVINGRLYAPEELLSASSPSTPPYKIVDVFPYKVLLEREGKTLELTYSNVASRSVSSQSAGGGARPGSAAAASRAQKSHSGATPAQSGEHSRSGKPGR